MSGTNDTRVVSLQFDNSEFDSRVRSSLYSLQELNTKLDSLGNNSSMSRVSAGTINATSGIDGMAASVDFLQKRFSTMGIISMTVISNLTTSAMNFISKIGGFVTNGIKQGGLTRALNIEQARFQMKGLGMDVEHIMGEGGPVQNAVKGTAYGLDEAAKAASMLGSSGVTDLGKLESALTAISGAAAMTGRGYSDIADIFTTVAANGKLMTMQIRQFAASGLNVGAALQKYYKNVKGINYTLEDLVGEKGLVSQGEVSFEDFANAMDWAFGEHAKDAGKTFNGAMSNMKAALSRIGADFFQPFLENMTKTFNVLQKFIDAIHVRITPAIETLVSFTDKAGLAFRNFMRDLTHSIEDANRVSTLGTIINSISSIIRSTLVILEQLFNIIKPFASLIIPVLVTGLDGIAKILSAISKGGLLEAIANKTQKMGNAMGVLAAIGEKLTGVFDRIKHGLVGLSKEVANAVSSPKGLGLLFNAGGIAVIGVTIKKFTKLLRSLDANMNIFVRGKFYKMFQNGKLNSSFSKVILAADRALDEIKDTFVEIQNTLKAQQLASIAVAIGVLAASIWLLSSISTADLAKSLAAIEILFVSLSGVTYYVRNFIKGVKIRTLLGATAAMIGISVAVAILAGAVKRLSGLNLADLAKGLGAIIVLLGSVVGVMAVLSRLEEAEKGTLSSGKLVALSVSLIGIGVAISIMAKAVSTLGSMNINDLIVGVTGVVGLMTGLAFVTATLGTTLNGLKTGQIIAMGIAMATIAVAIRILASSVKQLSSLNYTELEYGLVGVGVLLGGVATAMIILSHLVQKTIFGSGVIVSIAVGMVGIAAAIMILTQAVKVMGNMDGKALARGLGSVAGMLMGLLIFVNLLPPIKILAIATGLLGISAALSVMTGVIAALGHMDAAVLLQGLGAIAMVIGGLAASAYLVSAAIIPMMGLGVALALVGSGLILVSTGFGMFIAAIAAGLATITAMGSAIVGSFESITQYIIAFSKIAGIAFGNVIAEAIKTVVSKIPELISSFLSLIDETLNALVTKLPSILSKLTMLIEIIFTWLGSMIGPIVVKLVTILVSIINALIAKMEPLITSLVQLVISIIDAVAAAIEANSDKLIGVAMNLIFTMIKVLGKAALKLLPMGVKIGANILIGLKNKAKDIYTYAKTIPGKVKEWILAKVGELTKGGSKLAERLKQGFVNGITTLIKFVGGIPGRIAVALGGIVGKLKTVGKNAIQGLVNGLTSTNIATIASNLGTSLLNAVKKKLGIASPSKEMAKVGKFTIQGFQKGIRDNLSGLEDTITDAGGSVMNAMSEALSGAYDMAVNGIDDNPSISPVLDLSNIQSGMGMLDSMFSSRRAMSVNASIGRNKTTSELISDAVKDGMASLNNSLNNQNGTTYTFDIPLQVDGKDIAKATATYTQNELNKLQSRNNRQIGLVGV